MIVRMRKMRAVMPLCVLAIVATAFLFTSAADAGSLEELRQQLFDRRQRVQKVEERIKKYEEEIAKRRGAALTLQGQINVLEDGIEGLSLEIQKTEAEIEEVEAEIAAIKEEISAAERDILARKGLLKEYLRELQALDTDSTIEALLKYPTLSEAIKETRALYRVEQNSQEALDRIQEIKKSLQERAESFVDLQRELSVLQGRQKSQKITLEEQERGKTRLLEITKSQEAEFKKLLDASVAERRSTESEISRLDAEIRAELERQGITKLGRVGQFDWPLEAIFGVSCGFHCPDYPYARLIGPHSGIDLPTHAGTEIRAPADGYVGRVNIASSTGYSYILVIHGDNLSTVYGHITGAAVAEGTFVTRGQVIGYTGGAPGTRGAGLSTGPHLHFEVRKSGIPVNPIAYLP